MDTVALATRLADAVTSRSAIEPLTNEYPDLSVDAAYDIQDATMRRLMADGEIVTTAKLGLTSRAKQQQMHVDEPLYGWMTDRMQLAPGKRLVVADYIQPRVEPEVAFLIGSTLHGPGTDAEAVMAATTWVAPALDVLDSRFTGYKFTLADVTADNASAAGYVLGEPASPDVDLRLTGCVFERNGELVATAAGAAVMEDPAEAVAWLVRKLHARGRAIEAGTVVLAGAWTAAVAVEAGDHVLATFDHLGSVEVRCI